jgi:hypothetical protein
MGAGRGPGHLLRGPDFRGAHQPGGHRSARIDRCVRLALGSRLYRRTDRRRFLRFGAGVPGLPGSLARDGRSASDPGVSLHQSGDPPLRTGIRDGIHRDVCPGFRRAGDRPSRPGRRSGGRSLDLGRRHLLRSAPDRVAGAVDRPVAGRADRLRDQPGPRLRTSARSRRVADPRQRHSDWAYAWVPIAAPIAGGIAGAQVFQLLGL